MKDGGPAFPREDYQTNNAGGQIGMSLRDYFAAKVMAAIMANEAYEYEGRVPIDVIPEHAYALADAMLKARNS